MLLLPFLYSVLKFQTLAVTDRALLLSRFRFRFPKELTQRYDFIFNYQIKNGKSLKE